MIIEKRRVFIWNYITKYYRLEIEGAFIYYCIDEDRWRREPVRPKSIRICKL